MKNRNFNEDIKPPENERLKKSGNKTEESKLIRVSLDAYIWIRQQAFDENISMKDFIDNLVEENR